MFKRIIVIIMDSVGIGYGPDAAAFGDEGANTVGHIEKATGGIRCPNLKKLGLAKIADVAPGDEPVTGIYGRMAETSRGKDTTSGHWELMGHPVEVPFPVFYEGFPAELMERFTQKTGYGWLGNESASGTEIIERLGREHLRTGKPIVYTSADSVFQIAAHTDIIPLEELYRLCRITRDEACVGDYHVGRVIARPFTGEPGHFVRTADRHDYSRLPEHELDLELLKKAGFQTIGVGKIGDIYAHLGLTASYPTRSNSHGMNELAQLLGGEFQQGLMMANLVEFDSLYGHRRDTAGYARAIEDFDYQLGGFLELLEPDDLLLISADHGNDPTWPGTDHTRELVPVLGYYKGITDGIAIGDRTTFADLGQTVLDNFHCGPGKFGTSFLAELHRK